MLGSVENVREIEVGDVVADQEVWVYDLDKRLPGEKHLLLIIVGPHDGAGDAGAGFQGENEPYQIVVPVVQFYNRGYLDYRIPLFKILF